MGRVHSGHQDAPGLHAVRTEPVERLALAARELHGHAQRWRYAPCRRSPTAREAAPTAASTNTAPIPAAATDAAGRRLQSSPFRTRRRRRPASGCHRARVGLPTASSSSRSTATARAGAGRVRARSSPPSSMTSAPATGSRSSSRPAIRSPTPPYSPAAARVARTEARLAQDARQRGSKSTGRPTPRCSGQSLNSDVARRHSSRYRT